MSAEPATVTNVPRPADSVNQSGWYVGVALKRPGSKNTDSTNTRKQLVTLLATGSPEAIVQVRNHILVFTKSPETEDNAAIHDAYRRATAIAREAGAGRMIVKGITLLTPEEARDVVVDGSPIPERILTEDEAIAIDRLGFRRVLADDTVSALVRLDNVRLFRASEIKGAIGRSAPETAPVFSS